MTITSNPNTPENFARYYNKSMNTAVAAASGTDGRLSTREAKEISGDLGKAVESFFEYSRQGSVGAKRIVAATTERALEKAEGAIDNGKINRYWMPGDLAEVYLRFTKTIPAHVGHLPETELCKSAEAVFREKIAPYMGWNDLGIDLIENGIDK